MIMQLSTFQLFLRGIKDRKSPWNVFDQHARATFLQSKIFDFKTIAILVFFFKYHDTQKFDGRQQERCTLNVCLFVSVFSPHYFVKIMII